MPDRRGQLLVAIIATCATLLALVVSLQSDTNWMLWTIASVGIAGSLAMFAQRQHTKYLSRLWAPRSSVEEAAVRRLKSIVDGLEANRNEIPLDLSLTIESPRGVPSVSGVKRLEQPLNLAAMIAAKTDAMSLALLVGPRGSGKSAVLNRMATGMADRWLGEPGRRDSLIPLWISCDQLSMSLFTQTSALSFEHWVSSAVTKTYELESPLVWHWLRRERAILLIDAVDAIPQENRQHFFASMASWRHAHTAPIVVASEDSLLPQISEAVDVDTIATIQPIEQPILSNIFQRLYDETKLPDKYQGQLASFARTVQETYGEQTGYPLVISLLSEGLMGLDPRIPEFRTTPQSEEQRERAATLDAADFLLAKSDLSAARDAYKRVAELPNLGLRTRAQFRLALVLQLEGDPASARQALQQSIASKLEESATQPPLHSALTHEEEVMLGALDDSVSYDAAQLAARSELPVSAARRALEGLQSRGIIEVAVGIQGLVRYRLFGAEPWLWRA